MNDVMIDLETLGNTHDAPVIQIGAVWFSRDGRLGPELKMTIDFDSACTKRRVDGGTVAWWMRQDEEARKSVLGGKMRTKDALDLLAFFLSGRNDLSANLEKNRIRAGLGDSTTRYEPPSRDPKIWSVGFNDAGQLESLYRLYRITCPFKFYLTRDCRTIEEVSPISRLEAADGYNDGTHHDALSDARYQVKWLTAMLKLIDRSDPPEPEFGDL